MDQSIPDIEPLQIPRDAHFITRVSSEFLLRAFDALGDVEDDTIEGLVLVAFVRNRTIVGSGQPISVREMSRRLDMPYTTVRRHVETLVQARRLVAKKNGLVVPDAVLRSCRVTEFLRKIYVEASRLLVDLTRIGAAAFAAASNRPARSGRLTAEQTVIAIVATGLLLAGVREVRAFWNQDLTKGMVYTAIWTANIKHVTNTGPAASRSILPDSQRLPVSVLAISRSLRLPYETVRRHANVLIGDGVCARTPGHGLVVPTGVHHRTKIGAIIAHRVTMELLAELRRAGIKA
jgi:DNA-binding transcriptional ArsR family regulator